MHNLPRAIIVMKVGPHSGMTLDEIIFSKQVEENFHGVHYWGYSGNFCLPKPTQEFCKRAKEIYGENPQLILLQTKSAYKSTIGEITHYSEDGETYVEFNKPVQLQGAKFSFVAKKIREINNFDLSNYIVVGGKNAGRPLAQHFRGRVNKSFAQLSLTCETVRSSNEQFEKVLVAELTYPYAVWLKSF